MIQTFTFRLNDQTGAIGSSWYQDLVIKVLDGYYKINKIFVQPFTKVYGEPGITTRIKENAPDQFYWDGADYKMALQGFVNNGSYIQCLPVNQLNYKFISSNQASFDGYVDRIFLKFNEWQKFDSVIKPIYGDDPGDIPRFYFYFGASWAFDQDHKLFTGAVYLNVNVTIEFDFLGTDYIEVAKNIERSENFDFSVKGSTFNM